MALEGQVLGDFRILHEIGRGGMGIVYLAEQVSLSRRVALKVLPSGKALSEDVLVRFRREAEAASRLDHPFICAVYASGAHEGIPFIAMRHVEGMPLSRYMREKRAEATGNDASKTNDTFRFDFEEDSASATAPKTTVTCPEDEDIGTSNDDATPEQNSSISATREDIRWAVHLIEKASRALHVAHEARVIHRDIKPGNIMVTPDHDPVLLDFGLARSLEGGDEGPSLTQSGDLMGTPHYMSPEQLNGNTRVDARTDVYSLGVTLYELIAGRRPFEAPNREQLYRSILHEEHTPINRLSPLVERDLEIVLATALEKDLNRRYQTAAALANDLKAILQHEAIAARPIGRVLRARKWFRRNPVIATVGFSAFFVLVLLLAESWFYSKQLEAEKKIALDAKRDADISRDAANKASEKAREAATQARTALRQSDALRFAAEAAARASSEPALALALALQASQIEPTVETDRALRIALGASPEELLLPAPRIPSLVTNPETSIQQRNGGGKSRRVAGSRGPGERSNERLRETVPPTGDIHWGKKLAITLATGPGGVPVVWDLTTGQMVSVLAAHERDVFTARFNRTGTLAVTAGSDGKAYVFDVSTGLPLSPESLSPPKLTFGGTRRFETAWFSPIGRTTHRVVGVTEGGIYTWRQRFAGSGDFRLTPVSQDAYRAVRSGPIAASHSRWPLIANAARERVFVWNTVSSASQASQQVIAGGASTVSALAWSPTMGALGTSSKLAIGDADGRITMWEVPRRAGELVRRVWKQALDEHDGAITSLEFSPDGKWLASGSTDELVGCWNAESGTHRWRPFRHDRPVRDLSWSRDGSLIATGAADNKARILEAATGALRQSFAGHPDWVVRVEFDDAGRQLYTQSYDGSARLHRVSRQRGDEIVHNLRGEISSLEWSPVEPQLSITSRDGRVHLVDMSDPDPAPRPLLIDPDVLGVRFLPDGEHLVALSKGADWLHCVRVADGTIEWKRTAKTSAPVSGRVRSFLAPSFDGRELAVASPGGTPQIIRSSDGKILARPALLENPLHLVTAARPGHREFLIWSPQAAILRHSDNGLARTCDTRSLTGHPVDATFSSNGRYLALTDSHQKVVVFDIADSSALGLVPLQTARRMAAPPAWLPGVASLVFAPQTGNIRIVNIGGDGMSQELGLPAAGIELLRMTSSGTEVVAVKQGEVVIWDVPRNRERARIPFGSASVTDWDISPEGLLALGLESGTVRIVPLDAVFEALRRIVRPPLAVEMDRFGLGSKKSRDARRKYEAQLIRDIELEALRGRAECSGQAIHHLTYARRIMDEKDPVRERMTHALEAASRAVSTGTPGPPAYQILAYANHYNGKHDDALDAIRTGIQLADGSEVTSLEDDLRFFEEAAKNAHR